MYYPEYIKIKNFGSIESMEYYFQSALSQIIQGKNLEDKGQRSNGVGKSSFIDAISFCYTGISVRKLNIDELIRDNEKTATLEHSLRSKDGIDHFLIKRKLDRKEPQLIEIFKNGVPVHKNEHDVNARNALILKEIGINQEDLFNFFIVTTERYKTYFKMSDTEKKNIVSRFANSFKVDGVFDLLDIDIAQVEKKISNLNLTISNLTTKLNTYQEEKENLSQNQEENTKILKNNLNDKITEEQGVVLSLQEEIKALDDKILLHKKDIADNELKLTSKEDLDAKEQLITDLDAQYQSLFVVFEKFKKEQEVKVVAVEVDQKKIRAEIFELNNSINEVEVLKAQIESKLETSIHCPACDFEFIVNSITTKEELSASLEETKTIIEEIKVELLAKNSELDIFKKKLDTLNNEITSKRNTYTLEIANNSKQKTFLNTTVSQLKKSNDSINNDIANINNTIIRINLQITTKNSLIDSSKNKIINYQTEIENLQIIDNSQAILRYEALITENQLSLTINEVELTKEQNELQRLNSWTLKFKSFKSYLANQSVKNIEELTNFYLQKMNTNLTVEMSSQQKKKKEIKEKFSEIINRNGFPIGSYGRFSGGERGRLDFGLILCKQTLINNNASPKGLDFLLIDEILDSMDALGIESIIKSMDGIDKILFLVTQNEINTLPKQTLTFVKRNGKTEIE